MGPKPGASLLQDFYSFCCCWMFNWLLIKANTEPPVQHILRDWQASWWVDSLLPCKGQYFILIRIDDIPCVDLSFLLVGLSYYHHPRTQSVQLTATAETLIYDWSYTNSHQTKKSTLSKEGAHGQRTMQPNLLVLLSILLKSCSLDRTLKQSLTSAGKVQAWTSHPAQVKHGPLGGSIYFKSRATLYGTVSW